MTDVAPTIFPGTTDEGVALLRALSLHCQCVLEASTQRRIGDCCPAHSLLLDERLLGHLLFVRRMRERLIDEEWREDPVIALPEEGTC